MIFDFVTNKLFKKLLDGIIAAGDSKKLGGKSASEYANVEKEYLATSIKEKALEIPIGIYFYHLGGTLYSGGDLPNNDNAWAFGSAMVVKRGLSSIEIILFTESLSTIAINAYNGVKWSGWQANATTADLANYAPKRRVVDYSNIDNINESGFYIVTGTPNVLLHIEYDVNFAFQIMMSYADGNNMKWRAKQTVWYEWYESNNYLPKSGGKIDGVLEVASDGELDRFLTVKNSLRDIYQHVTSKGIYNLYDATNHKAIITSDANGDSTFNGTASGNLPITGGELANDNGGVLSLHNTTANAVLSLLRFKANGAQLGMLGFNGTDNPVFRNSSGSQEYKLHHDGNSTKIAFTESDAAAPSDTTALWAHL